MDQALKILVAGACFTVIAVGGTYGWAAWAESAAKKQEQEVRQADQDQADRTLFEIMGTKNEKDISKRCISVIKAAKNGVAARPDIIDACRKSGFVYD